MRRRGTGVPKASSAKTLLGFGQGSVVEPRMVIYESKNILKINVSLRRKIHIMALPQGTPLNAL
jgi:hypothetical protein